MRIQPAGRRWLLSIGLVSLVATVAATGNAATRPASASANTKHPAATPPDVTDTSAQITALLTNFLSPAVMATAAGHDRFWADDLVYTSSAGKVMTKADILKSFADAPKPVAGKSASDKSSDPDPVFTAEDILVRPYGDMAALTFRLVERDPDGKVSTFRNSGTFVKRGGKWQAVTWQATKVATDKSN